MRIRNIRSYDSLRAENKRLRKALEDIRDIAVVSEGVEFYAMLAERALKGECENV
jgi:hypothetical protein|tara:strand:- start:514 stop:678 length:165 start_codon:yes stop_codon:yes gene_type:complete